MPHALRACLALAALILLAGCETITPVGQRVAPGITWRCDGSRTFSASIGSRGAEVHAGGRDYALPHAPGSGARYAAGGAEYWERAGQASLTGAAGGPYRNCRH